MSEFDYTKVKQAAHDLLVALGEDPGRDGLVDTPRRVADFWREFVEYDAGNVATVFDSVHTDQLVCVSGMRVWSLCEHHLLPFWCDIAVGYIADDRVLGLSKFARVAHKHAHKLQVQERLVTEIAEELQCILCTDNVAVVARGEHLCMTMRGIRTPHKMTSSAMLGVFRDNHAARAELLGLLR